MGFQLKKKKAGSFIMLMMMCCWNGKQPVYRTFYQHKSVWVVPVSISITWGGGRGYGGQNTSASSAGRRILLPLPGRQTALWVFVLPLKWIQFKTKRQCAVCLRWRGLAGAILHSVLMGQLWSLCWIVRLFL